MDPLGIVGAVIREQAATYNSAPGHGPDPLASAPLGYRIFILRL